jgi:hypothetical protein
LLARFVYLLISIFCISTAVQAGPVAERIRKTTYVLPAQIEPGPASYCIGGNCYLSPRTYLAPRSDGSYWLGWTGNDGQGRISLLGPAGISLSFGFAGEQVRGLVAHDDGGFAVLLRRASNNSMRLTRRSVANVQLFSTAITNSNAIAQQNTGDARLAFGDGRYAAYFAVHGISGGFGGHEGDQLAFLSATGAPLAGGWEWGCSHQMAGLVGWHPRLNRFSALCVSDCYADKGIVLDNSSNLYALDAGCNGTVWGQFGQLAAAENSWKLAFVAQDRPGYPGRGVGLLSFGASGAASTIWLTGSDGSRERDPVMARIGSSVPERFLVGWREEDQYRLGIIDAAGSFVQAAETIPAVAWGDRDDSLRSTPAGKVAWISADVFSVTLHEYAESGADMVFRSGFQ